MSAETELDEILNTTHHYRRELKAIESRNGSATQDVVDNPLKVDGYTREKIERMDADLSVAELRAQNKALEARLAKLERTPILESRAPGGGSRAGSDTDPSSEAYARRWMKAILSNNDAEMRALATTSANAPVPTDMERRIVERMYQTNVLRQIAVVRQINSKRAIPVENALPTVQRLSEAAASTPSDPTYSTQISVNPIEYHVSTELSRAFIEDSFGEGDIGSGMDWVAGRMATALGLFWESDYTVGTNSSQPEGIAGSSAQTKIAGVSQVTDLGAGVALTSVTADQLIDTVHLVAPAYRNSPRFRWLISDAFLRTVRKLKNGVTTSGPQEYIWTPGTANANSLVGGAPAQIYGVPYSIGQYVPTTTANNAIYAVVGDFNYFEIFDRVGMESMSDPYSKAANRQIVLHMWGRTDAKIMLPNAFAAITG